MANELSVRVQQFLAEKNAEPMFHVEPLLEQIQARKFSIAPSLIAAAKRKEPKALKEIEEAWNIIKKIGHTGKIKPKEGFAIKPQPKKTRTKFLLPEGIDLVVIANSSNSLDEVLSKLSMECNQKNRSNISMKLSLLRKDGKEIKQFPRGRKPQKEE